MQHVLGPALAGHAFQQTALIGMLPVLALRLGLPQGQVGLAIGIGLVASAMAAPVLAARLSTLRLRLALIVLMAASLALIAMLLAPRPVQAAFALLLVIRMAQGTAGALILSAAQGASAQAGSPVSVLARLQIGPGLGRALGAALIGPLLRLSVALPMLPALVGAAISLRRLAGGGTPALRGARGFQPPWPAALSLPFWVQCAVGAGQLGLGPLLAQSRGATQAATIAGLCLGAGYLALLLTHRFLTPAATALGPAAMVLVAAMLLPVLSPRPAVLIVATALAAAASGLMIARHLARVVALRPAAARHNAAWQGSALLAGLGCGAGAAALVLPIAPAAPFLLAGGFALIVLVTGRRPL